MKKVQALIGLLITGLFLIPMVHSQDEIYVAQGISVTDCAEFSHGYGLSLSPGRMDAGGGLGLSVDGFSPSFLEQYKDRIINVGDRIVGLQTDIGEIDTWDMPFANALGYIRAFSGTNTSLIIIPANQELNQQNELIIKLPLVEIDNVFVKPENDPFYADYSISYPDDPKFYRCTYNKNESMDDRTAVYIGPIDNAGEKTAGVGDYVTPSYFLRGLLTESQDGNLLGNGVYIFTQRKLENLSYAFDSQAGTWNKENQFTGERETWISQDGAEFLKMITNFDSGIFVEKVVESHNFLNLDTPPDIRREVFDEDIDFNEPPDKYVDFLEQFYFYTPHAEVISDGVMRAWECERSRSYNFLTKLEKPGALSNCLVNVFSITPTSSEPPQELYSLRMAGLLEPDSISPTLQDESFSEIAANELIKKVADGVIRIKFSEGGLYVIDFPSGVTFEGEFPFGDVDRFLNANLLADTTKRGISYLNGVGRLYETGSRRSRQEAESLRYVDGRAIPRVSQSSSDLNRTIAITERTNQTREQIINRSSQAATRQTQRRTIQTNSFWDKALKVVVGVATAYVAYEIIDAVADTGVYSRQVSSRARPRPNMLLPSRSSDSDVQAPPMIRFGWNRDSAVLNMDQSAYQVYTRQLESNFNQVDGYRTTGSNNSICTYQSQGEVFRVSRAVVGISCPFKLKLPNLFSNENYALNQVNRAASGIYGLLDTRENYFGKNYCAYSPAGTSPIIVPKGKSAQCPANISL